MTFKYVLQACIVYTIYRIKNTYTKSPKYEPCFTLMIGSVLPFRVDVGNEFACIVDRNPDCNRFWDASSTEK